MKRLCYGVFANALWVCAPHMKQNDLHNKLFASVIEGYEALENTEATDCFNCKRNLPPHFIDKLKAAEPSAIADNIRAVLTPDIIDPSRIPNAVYAIRAVIADDDTIADSAVVDRVDGTTKGAALNAAPVDGLRFLAGAFICAALRVKNKDGQDCVKSINSAFVEDAMKRFASDAPSGVDTVGYGGGTTGNNDECHGNDKASEKSRDIVITASRPLHPTDYFIGRDGLLAKIRTNLVGNAKMLLLNGMGGIGKTEVCRKLFHEAQNGLISEVTRLGWITYGGTLEQSFFRQFNEIENPADKPAEYYLQAEKYINALGSALLLFVDNANELTEKEAARLLQLNCKIVLTSRYKTTERLQAVEIGKLSIEDCRVLYRWHLQFTPFDRDSDSNYNLDFTPNPAPDEDLDEIIKSAGRHTLAIELLAKTQAASYKNYAQFRKLLEDEGFSLAAITERVTYVHNPEHGDCDHAEQVFIEQFAKVLDISGIKGERLKIMQRFSLLAPEPVLGENVEKWLVLDDYEDLTALVKRGWLSSGAVGAAANEWGFSMHPLISSVVRYKATPDEETAKPVIEGLIDALGLPDDEVFTGKLSFTKHAVSTIEAIVGTDGAYIDLVNHASNILLRFSDYTKAEKILLKAENAAVEGSLLAATLHNNLGMAYERQGEYAAALEEYEKGRDAFLATVGEEHRDTATAYNNIAGVYSTLGRYKEALELLEKAAATRERVLGAEHTITQSTYNNMAVVLSILGDYDKALELLNHLLDLAREQGLPPEHPHFAIAYGNIAEVLNTKGDYDGALEWEKKAIDIMENNVGKDNPETANAYNSAARVYANKGDFKTALDYYGRALEIYVKRFGEEHYESALVVDNIGQIYDLTGDYPKAFELTQKALGIVERIFGEGHLNTVFAYSNLAGVYSHTGEYLKAIELNERVLSIRENALGKFHPDVAVVYNNLADVYIRVGDYKKAVGASETALDILENSVGLEHPTAASAYNNIGNALMRLNMFKEAESYYELALDIDVKTLGEEHPNTASAYDALAGVYSRFADYKTALETYFRALGIKERTIGTEHPKTAVTYSNIAGVYDLLGEYEQAREWYLKAFAIREAAFGRENADTAYTLNNLASIDDALGDHAKAIEGYKEVLTIREKIFGAEHQSVAFVCNNIGLAYDRLGEKERALEWHGRALDIKVKTFGADSLSAAFSYVNLAGVYFDMGDYNEAEDNYRRALAIRTKFLGEEHPDVAAVCHGLGCTLQKRGRLDEALGLLSKAFEIRLNKFGAEHLLTADSLGCLKAVCVEIHGSDAGFDEWLG